MLSSRAFSTRSLLAGTIIAGAAVLGAPAAFAETPADTLVIANTIDDIKSLDPAQSFEFSGQDTINNMYETLIEIDPETLEPVPGLATSWSVDEAGKVFTFELEEGRTFSSGNPVRAEDVVWSLQRAVKLDLTPSFIITQFGLTPENVEANIRAVDENTVEIETDRTFAPSFVYNAMTAEVTSIVDKETVMANAEGDDMGNAWLSTNSAGSGPYTLRSWSPNESVILDANENWDGDVAMRRVFVRHVAEPATQRLLLENGDIDIARNLTPEDIAAVEAADGLKVYTQRRGQIYYLSGNQLVEPLNDPKVMQAIKYLIDYQGMADTFLKGKNEVHQAFLPAGFLGALTDTPYSLDVEKAKALLAEAGHPDGFEVEILTRNEQEPSDIVQAIQATLAQAGIDASIRAVTGSESLSIYRARDHELTLQTWGPDYPDPHTNASVFAANPDNSEEAQLTGNLAWRNAFAAEETTPMVEAAVVEQDTDERIRLYEEMQRISREQSPFIPMFQRTEQAGMQENVEGFSAGGAVSNAYYWPVTKDGGDAAEDAAATDAGETDAAAPAEDADQQ